MKSEQRAIKNSPFSNKMILSQNKLVHPIYYFCNKKQQQLPCNVQHNFQLFENCDCDVFPFDVIHLNEEQNGNVTFRSLENVLQNNLRFIHFEFERTSRPRSQRIHRQLFIIYSNFANAKNLNYDF